MVTVEGQLSRREFLWGDVLSFPVVCIAGSEGISPQQETHIKIKKGKIKKGKTLITCFDYRCTINAEKAQSSSIIFISGNWFN